MVFEMKPILVHLHIFYPEFWPELKGYLQNVLVYPHEIYITAVESLPSIEAEVKAMDANVHFDIIENRGYDVGSFISVLNRVNLDDFSYVIKLHSKRNCPVRMYLGWFNVGGNKWRTYLCDFMKHLPKCLEAFEQDKTLGMVANYHVMVSSKIDCYRPIEDNIVAQQVLDSYHKCNFEFVAGTMFMCRACLLQKIKSMGFDLNDFAEPTRGEQVSLAHDLERFFSLTILKQGYKIKDCFSPISRRWGDNILICLKWINRFIYHKKITKKGKLLVKICKIPVLSLKRSEK